jgi:phosphoglycolate phosphatase-like HAD superfamily hydrolase
VNLLVLFDIDGTLVLTGHAGVRGMNLAFGDLHGNIRALDGVPIAGRTDKAIVIDAMRGIGVEPSDDAIAALRDAYITRLRVEITRPTEHPSLVLPGVGPLLDALASQPGVVTALLTGNFVEGADVKLRHFDLWDRFTFGAFGDDHVDRRALVPVAIQRAHEAGLPALAPDRIVIIGDTPYDIDCARAHGAKSIGVATGSSTRAELAAEGADLAVDTLEPLDEVMNWLLSPQPQPIRD